MRNLYNELTRNIRIPSKTHELLKSLCQEEGRLIGAYVNGVILKAIDASKTSPAGSTKVIDKN